MTIVEKTPIATRSDIAHTLLSKLSLARHHSYRNILVIVGLATISKLCASAVTIPVIVLHVADCEPSIVLVVEHLASDFVISTDKVTGSQSIDATYGVW